MARHYNQWRCLFGSLDFSNRETSNWNHLLWMTRFFSFVANSLISFLNSYVAQIINMGYLEIQIPTWGPSETDRISPRVFKPESANSLSMEKTCLHHESIRAFYSWQHLSIYLLIYRMILKSAHSTAQHLSNTISHEFMQCLYIIVFVLLCLMLLI